jgi:DNA replication protein DnaC
MLQCYIKETINADPLKPKMMKLTHIRKVAFNINGTTIHSTLAIPLNKFFNELKTLNDEKCDTLTKTYVQFQLVVIDELFLVDNKLLIFIDHRLHVIKQII